MTFELNRRLLEELVEASGGVNALLGNWMELSPDKDDPISASEINRWINGRSKPRNSAKYLRLSASLDVDPFVLLEPRHADPLITIRQLVTRIQEGRERRSAFGFLHDFFGWLPEWPPSSPGLPTWIVKEFKHDPRERANYAGLILLDGNKEHCAEWPQAFHFAFSPQVFAPRSWLQYGTVFRRGMEAKLWHIKGHSECLSMESSADPTAVKTWLGPGECLFRIASKHRFEHRLLRDYPDTFRALAFPG